jgi:hypothetical protein
MPLLEETTRLRIDAEQRQWLERQAEIRGGRARNRRGGGKGLSDVVRDCIDLARRTSDAEVGPLTPAERRVLRLFREMRGDHADALKAVLDLSAYAAQDPAVTAALRALSAAFSALAAAPPPVPSRPKAR